MDDSHHHPMRTRSTGHKSSSPAPCTGQAKQAKLPGRRPTEMERVLSYLHSREEFDFNSYLPSCLTFAIRRRMKATGIKSLRAYLEYLNLHSMEQISLRNSNLVNATTFFRDPSAWDYLSDSIIPSVCLDQLGRAPLRFWCAGCATGQELYTLAMLLAEHGAGSVPFRVFGTDINAQSIRKARAGLYSPAEVRGIPLHLLTKYFRARGTEYVFRKPARCSLGFGEHNLLRDLPISRCDMIICRYTMCYFRPEIREHLLEKFHHALNDCGVLFLGKTDDVTVPFRLFKRLNSWQAIYAKI